MKSLWRNYFEFWLLVKEEMSGDETSNNVVCSNSKDSDQPACMCSLIRAFASCLNIL